MHAGGTPLRLRNVDPNWNRLKAIGFFSHTMSRTDSSYQMAWSHLQWWSPPAHRAPCGFICCPQMKARIIRARCQTRWWCPSKPDPSDLLRWCAVISRLEACSRSTSYHPDSTDLPGHGNTSGRHSGVGGRQIVLATNRNGGMLRLNATRHDDDDDYVLSGGLGAAPPWLRRCSLVHFVCSIRGLNLKYCTAWVPS